MGIRVNEIDCASCLIYDYHTYNLPEKITTQAQKYKDTVLTIACNTCTNCSNYIPNNPGAKVNERFLKSLEMKFKVVRCDHSNDQERCRNAVFHFDGECLYEIDGFCALKSKEAEKCVKENYLLML
ncbi:MAG: hypothetical protein AB1485_09050 [Candidatus Thermoplasmatota archaeon]